MLKFLDYEVSSPFSLIIGRPRKLAWPVDAYRITLPKVSKDSDELNAFERVILSLLEFCGQMRADELADETCIPIDLVKSILLRLQDKELIDEYNGVVSRGQNDGATHEDFRPVFVTALLFRELATGKILPFVHQIDDANPLKKTIGDENDFHRIQWVASHKRNAPTQRDVINALRSMKKRAALFGLEHKMPAPQLISIAREPEFLHLNCSIAIQKSDGEFRIADPFGNGFSLTLEHSFEQILESDEDLAEWLLGWKERLSNPQIEQQEFRPKSPYETKSNWQRYPNLISSLKPVKNAQFRNLTKIHASIEWALFYVCSRRPFNDVVTTLKLTQQTLHASLLTNAAETLGFHVPSQGFRPIRDGKLLDFENGRAYQETLIAIAILQACNDPAHPVRRLASAHPDLINRLIAINAKRNEKAHGKGGADAPQQELEDDSFLREFVHSLLPDIVFSDKPNYEPDQDAQGDLLLDAIASIQAEFGFRLFNLLGRNLQERLIQAERFFLSCDDDDDSAAYIGDLYAAAQASFEKFLAGKLPPDLSDTQLIGIAESKAFAADLCGEFPESLRTVRIMAIRQTLQGASQSLGACVIALLLVSDEGSLAAIHDRNPSFLGDMANLIILRGHGNEPKSLSKKIVANLRKSVLSTIKTLLEQ